MLHLHTNQLFLMTKQRIRKTNLGLKFNNNNNNCNKIYEFDFDLRQIVNGKKTLNWWKKAYLLKYFTSKFKLCG